MDQQNLCKHANELAKNIAIKAGQEVLKIYYSDEDSHIKNKDNNSPLSKADLLANDIITNAIRKSYPQHAILTEEETDDNKRFETKYVWIIDPIDGTRDFLEKTGEFTINIALVDTKTQRPIVGVIYVPVKDELYHATKFQQTMRIKNASQDNKQEKKINVSKINKLSEMTLAKSVRNAKPKFQQFIQRFPPKKVISIGSTLKGCAVANGSIDLYLRACPYSEWDCCAMDLIIHKAGGKVTLWDGTKRKYNQKDIIVNGIICSNNTIHEELLDKCAKLNEK